MTPPHRANSHTKGSLGFRSDFAFGVGKKERFTGPVQDLSGGFRILKGPLRGVSLPGGSAFGGFASR